MFDRYSLRSVHYALRVNSQISSCAFVTMIREIKPEDNCAKGMEMRLQLYRDISPILL